MQTERVFLSLGSNVGDRLAYLRKAVQRLARLPKTVVVRTSSVYESAPVGYTEQGAFLNQAVEVVTALTPDAFLQATQRIEQALGRERTVRWGPRTLDIDIVYWGERCISSERLTVPHPEAETRRFVLLPLSEIAGDFRAPPRGEMVRTLLARLGGRQTVEVYRSQRTFELN